MWGLGPKASKLMFSDMCGGSSFSCSSSPLAKKFKDLLPNLFGKFFTFTLRPFTKRLVRYSAVDRHSFAQGRCLFRSNVYWAACHQEGTHCPQSSI